MKKNIQIALLMIITTLAACKKDDTNATKDGFRWTDSSNTTEMVADSAWVNAQYNTIIAQKTGATKVEINLSSISAATYTVSSGTQNTVTFIINNDTHIATSGTVIVTTNQDNKLTGTFDVVESGVVGSYSAKGTFTNIPIRP